MVYVQFVSYLILVISVLVSVAFLTLLERKILGFIQIRKGPNKVGWGGLFQPFADAVKLFTKEQTFPTLSNFVPYYVSPVFSLFISLGCWLVVPHSVGLLNFDLGVLFFLCILSVGVYPLLGGGWSSNSKYCLLGCLRAIAQIISYEVSLALILLSLLLLVGSFDLSVLESYQRYVWFGIVCFPLMVVWFISSLAETNRTPFDFAESESELVSGFNTEYSAGGFALIFMAEYSSILFMSMVVSMLFLGSGFTSILFYFKVVLIAFCFVWVRGTLPRFRYDKLMGLCWKSYLPVSLNYMIFFLGLKSFLEGQMM